MDFQERVKALRAHHEELLTRKNQPLEWGNGIYEKYKYPILTAEHTPLEWKYDFNEKDNPYLMQRIIMNATLNSGAMKWQGKYILVVRVEGADRKSFFAVAESPNGIDNFRFWEEPITMPDDVIPATNVYDMRLTAHEDGWIYGVFWFCILNSSMANTPSILVHRMDLSIQVQAVVSAGHWLTTLPMQRLRKRRLSTSANIIPLRR